MLFELPPELDVGETAVPVVLEPPAPPTPPTPRPAALDAVLALAAEAAEAAETADDWLASCEDMEAGRAVVEADDAELVISGLRVEVAKPLRLEAAAATGDIDACDAVDCAKRKAASAVDCELRLARLEDIAALEGIEAVAIDFVSTCPINRCSI